MWINATQSPTLLADLPPYPRRAAQWWAKCGILLYTTYRTTNAARHGTRMDQEEAIQALKEATYEAVHNHPPSARLVA